jgi:general secretion pathway protein I
MSLLRSPALLLEEGFTLLETIIAMAIMVLALSAILAVESGSINASIRTREMNIVGMLAKRKMVTLEHAFEGKTFDEFKKEDAGAFETPYQDYLWKVTVKEIEFPSLSSGAPKDSSASASDGGGEMVEMISKLVTKFLSKSVREVNLTVSWNKGRNERSYALSTYWVDLNHEFELTP